MEFLRICYHVSVRRASQTLPGPRSTLYYRSRRPEQAPLRHRIKEIAVIRVRYGYRRIHTLLQREGWTVNHMTEPRVGQGRVQSINAYSIYLVDTLGGREMIYRDPKMSCFAPIPIRPRPVPPALPWRL